MYTLDDIKNMLDDAINESNSTCPAPILPTVSGKSAYEVAVENGYVGSETTWLASLKGTKGDKGDKGDTGQQGIQGDTGSIDQATLNSILARIKALEDWKANFNTPTNSNSNFEVQAFKDESVGTVTFSIRKLNAQITGDVAYTITDTMGMSGSTSTNTTTGVVNVNDIDVTKYVTWRMNGYGSATVKLQLDNYTDARAEIFIDYQSPTNSINYDDFKLQGSYSSRSVYNAGTGQYSEKIHEYYASFKHASNTSVTSNEATHVSMVVHTHNNADFDMNNDGNFNYSKSVSYPVSLDNRPDYMKLTVVFSNGQTVIYTYSFNSQLSTWELQ